MLRIKARPTIGGESVQVKYRDLYVSPDLSYITGVTDNSVSFNEDGTVTLSNSFETDVACEASFSVETRQGYTLNTVTLPLQHYEDENYNFDYVQFDGKYYYAVVNDIFDGTEYLCPGCPRTISLKHLMLNPDSLTMGDIREEVLEVSSANTISFEYMCWIDDGKINYSGTSYDIEVDTNVSAFTQGGESYTAKVRTGRVKNNDNGDYFNDIEVHLFDVSDFYKVKKFSIFNPGYVEYDMETVTCADYDFYARYKDTTCHVLKSYDDNGWSGTTTIGYRYKDIDGNDYTIDEKVLVYQKINDTLYPLSGMMAEEVSFASLKDEDLYAVGSDGIEYPLEWNLVNSNAGEEVIIYLKADNAPFYVGDRLTVNSPNLSSFELSLVEDDAGKVYAFYNNNKNYMEEHFLDEVTIDGNKFVVDYPNGYDVGAVANIVVGDDTVIEGILSGYSETLGCTEFIRRYSTVYSSGSSVNDITYGIPEPYSITRKDGFSVDGYKFGFDYEQFLSGNVGSIEVSGENSAEVEIKRVLGSSAFVCKPILDENVWSTSDLNAMYRSLCCQLSVSPEENTIVHRSRIFGDKDITRELGFIDNDNAVSTDDYYNLANDLSMYGISNFLNIAVPIGLKTSLSDCTDAVAGDEFSALETQNAITTLVDMEKDIYYPAYPSLSGSSLNEDGYWEDQNGNLLFDNIRELEFNFHFRTRDESSWKVIEDDGTYNTSGSCNWFVTDYYPYQQMIDDNTSSATTETARNVRELQGSSDLLGLAYFTNADVYYQKDRLSKTFVNLSFYDTTDPNTQSLLAYSTIFFDENHAFKKYVNNNDVPDKDITFRSVDKDSQSLSDSVTVLSEKYSGDTLLWDDDGRLSTRISVKNKYESDVSSEGFYLYMFKEYSMGFHPAEIYMKVEFKHAGVGRSIPFVLPVHIEEGNSHPLLLSNEEDLAELKTGVPLNELHSHVYIPMKGVYDFNHKRYVYFIDTDWIDRNRIKNNNGKLSLNLFELKIKNEASFLEKAAQNNA